MHINWYNFQPFHLYKRGKNRVMTCHKWHQDGPDDVRTKHVHYSQCLGQNDLVINVHICLNGVPGLAGSYVLAMSVAYENQASLVW